MNFERILVPMDFSQNSVNSLKCAVDFAKMFGSRITVLHAYYLSENYAQEAYISYLSSLVTDITQRIGQDFDRIIADLGAEELVDRKEVRYAAPVDAVIDVAREEKADLIILGRSGTNKLMDKTMGTVAYLVMKNAQCPVLAVPESARQIDFSRTMLAVAFRYPWKDSGLSGLRVIARKTDARITVVNVEQEGKPDSQEDLAGRTNQVRDSMTGMEHSFEVIRSNEVETGLNQFIEQHQITLLAMIPQHHSLLESVFRPSVTQRMTLHMSVPLLALK